MSGELAANVTHFARALRKAGLPVGPGRTLDAVAALAEGVGGREDFYWTLHALFVSRREHSVVFDQAFHLFWRKRGLIEKLIATLSPTAPATRDDRKPEAAALRVAEALGTSQPIPPREEDPGETLSARLTVSDREVLQAKDFAQMSAEEIAAAKALIARLVLPDDRVATRRFRPDARGARIDMRRLMRASLRTGGHVVALPRRAQAARHPPVVALVDISGSMAEYSRLFLHFLHALTARRDVKSFVFATRLTPITRDLKARDPDEALARAGRHAADWEGGTRISQALHLFNRRWLRRVGHGGPIVLLFTDGLERDPPERLAAEVARLRRSCRRLVWLNPLLRYDGFEPRAAGIRAMLPEVDDFRPIHNLSSMASLCAALGPPTVQGARGTGGRHAGGALVTARKGRRLEVAGHG